ncbi:MAG: DNA methylase [Clostridia bacterium]|nr:DNA methylase [Clostridia bacterium]
MDERIYAAIDLKSFYASVECVARGLDPLNTNLVVADETRTAKTICLAVSPSLKACGIPGRPRLFEAQAKLKEVNAKRRAANGGRPLRRKSWVASELAADRTLEADFIIAPPRMAKYMEVSSEIYAVYLRRIAPEDIHIYSVDEVFIDLTDYLKLYRTDARTLTVTLVRDVLAATGITATAGIGTNMYLAKVAMDIVAKHMPADSDGVRIAGLDEMSYRRELWTHRPLTDFWRVGGGYAARLGAMGLFTMGDIARQSVTDEERLYREFGVNAELLIDHAWGWEPARISDIRAYRPENSSLSSGQVLKHPYTFEKGRLVAREMTDLLALDLVEKKLVTDQMVLTVGYDVESLAPDRHYSGQTETDRYGRRVPKQSHGSINIGRFTSSSRLITGAVMKLYDRITDRDLLVRRMYVVANHVKDESAAGETAEAPEQLDIFTDYGRLEAEREKENAALEKEKRLQLATIEIKKRFGRNAVLKGMNLEEGATAVERNGQVGGHHA